MERNNARIVWYERNILVDGLETDASFQYCVQESAFFWKKVLIFKISLPYCLATWATHLSLRSWNWICRWRISSVAWTRWSMIIGPILGLPTTMYRLWWWRVLVPSMPSLLFTRSAHIRLDRLWLIGYIASTTTPTVTFSRALGRLLWPRACVVTWRKATCLTSSIGTAPSICGGGDFLLYFL